MQLVTGTGRLRCDEVTLPGLHGYINADMTWQRRNYRLWSPVGLRPDGATRAAWAAWCPAGR